MVNVYVNTTSESCKVIETTLLHCNSICIPGFHMTVHDCDVFIEVAISNN